MNMSVELLREVRIGLIRQGTTLNKFCAVNQLDGTNMHRFIKGEINSDNAIAQREVVIKAALPELEIQPQPQTAE